MTITLTAEELYDLFVHRKDVYALQQKNGAYFPEKEPVTIPVIERHLRGEITIGLYCLDLDNTCKWACIDLDGSDLRRLKQEAELMYKLFPEFKRMLEFSGRRGYHVWIFPEAPAQALYLQTLVKARLRRVGLAHYEVFPKQTELNATRKFGNLVKLPLAKHRKSGKFSEILQFDEVR